MHEGRIVGHISDVKNTSENELGLYMLGVKEEFQGADRKVLTVNKKFTNRKTSLRVCHCHSLVGSVIFAVSEEPVTAIYNLFLGPLQSKRHFFEVFASSVPLIFTGLALGLVFKSGNFSMIADACLYTGAVVTAALAIKTSLPFAVHPIVIMIAAAAVGG